MSTFAQIKTRVEGYLIDTPAFTVGLVGDWINKAVADAEGRHNYRHMAKTVEFTTAAETRLLGARPADWKEARGALEPPFLTYNDGGSRELAWAESATQMRRQFSVDDSLEAGAPKFILDEPEDGLLVYPYSDSKSDYPDLEYRVSIPYWAYSALLVNGGDTNFWTNDTAGEWFLTFYAMAEGALANRDTQEATIYFERAEVERKKSVRRSKQQATKPPHNWSSGGASTATGASPHVDRRRSWQIGTQRTPKTAASSASTRRTPVPRARPWLPISAWTTTKRTTPTWASTKSSKCSTTPRTPPSPPVRWGYGTTAGC